MEEITTVGGNGRTRDRMEGLRRSKINKSQYRKEGKQSVFD